MTDPSSDDLDAIAAALARLRGRGPGPGGHGGHGGPFGPGGPFGADGPFGPGAHAGRPQPDWTGEPDEARTPHGRGHGVHEGRGGAAGRGGPWGAIRMAGPARMRLLEALVAASHPLSVSEIGEAIGVDQPRASRLVQQAVDLGLVRREADPDDARRTRVALTDEGSRIVRGFRGQRREHLSQALAAFTDAERADLARLLSKLADAWPR